VCSKSDYRCLRSGLRVPSSGVIGSGFGAPNPNSTQRCHDILAVLSSTDVLVDFEDPSVGADVERPPRCQPDRSEYAVRPRRRFRRIAQNRKIEAERSRKLRVLLRCVDARGEIRDVEALQRVTARPERLALGRSPSRERFRKPRDDDRTCSDEVAQPICPMIGSLQLEIGRDVARLKVNRALEQPQLLSSVSCHSSKAFDVEGRPWGTFFCREVSFSKSTDRAHCYPFVRVDRM